MKHKSKTKRSIGPAGASIVSDDGKFLKLANELKGAASDSDKLKAFKKINDFFENIKKDTESKIKGIPSDADMKMLKKSVPGAKAGGLMEATAKLKAKGMKEGGMVVKDKTVAIDKSPNSGLITQRGFGASRRT